MVGVDGAVHAAGRASSSRRGRQLRSQRARATPCQTSFPPSWAVQQTGRGFGSPARNAVFWRCKSCDSCPERHRRAGPRRTPPGSDTPPAAESGNSRQTRSAQRVARSVAPRPRFPWLNEPSADVLNRQPDPQVAGDELRHPQRQGLTGEFIGRRQDVQGCPSQGLVEDEIVG